MATNMASSNNNNRYGLTDPRSYQHAKLYVAKVTTYFVSCL